MFVTSRAKVNVDSTGATRDIIIVLTPQGVLLPLLKYFRFHAVNRSTSWQKKVAQGVVLFMEYTAANPHERNRQSQFLNFALRVETGTFDSTTRLDSSRLCWTPRNPNVARGIIHSLTEFLKYVKRDRPLTEQINPEYARTSYDQMIDQAAYTYRREAAMLGYTWSQTLRNGDAPSVRGPRPPKVTPQLPPAFPETRFEELLVKGFLGGRSRDYRGACITLLLHGAGFRESEPFHLFVEDVFPAPLEPMSSAVNIHHPMHGEPPSDWTADNGRPSSADRAHYLAQVFGLRPRNQLACKLHAGWKNPLLDHRYYMRAHWFTDLYGRWFKELWDGYIRQLVNVPRGHPWAFVNLSREPVGAPYKLGQFIAAHAAACERIGLTPAKPLGTTPHGHRHAYGQRLQMAEIDPAYIKLFMHHKSIDAQRTYTSPNPSEVAAAIAEGMKKLATKNTLPNSQLLDAGELGTAPPTNASGT